MLLTDLDINIVSENKVVELVINKVVNILNFYNLM